MFNFQQLLHYFLCIDYSNLQHKVYSTKCNHIFSRFTIIIYISLNCNEDYHGVEIIELRHDNERKSGRSATVRQKSICRPRERRDAARRVASRRIVSPSNFVFRECDWLSSRTEMILDVLREAIDRIRRPGWSSETRRNVITREKK